MIIIVILWAIMVMTIFIQYAPVCKGLKVWEFIAVGLIFVVGAPFFMFTEILQALLDCFLPEGWDDDGPKM